MADTDTQEQDPSIEEILASIRQIISDDDEEETEGAAKTSAPAKEETPEPIQEPIQEAESDDAFELTSSMKVAEEALERTQPDEFPEDVAKEIFTEPAAAATVGAFSKLSENVALSAYTDNITLEDIVKDMLRPMLREWIDSNMPRIVEVLVEKELEKLARHAKDS